MNHEKLVWGIFCILFLVLAITNIVESTREVERVIPKPVRNMPSMVNEYINLLNGVQGNITDALSAQLDDFNTQNKKTNILSAIGFFGAAATSFYAAFKA